MPYTFQLCPHCWHVAIVLRMVFSLYSVVFLPVFFVCPNRILSGRNSSLKNQIHQPIRSQYRRPWICLRSTVLLVPTLPSCTRCTNTFSLPHFGHRISLPPFSVCRSFRIMPGQVMPVFSGWIRESRSCHDFIFLTACFHAARSAAPGASIMVYAAYLRVSSRSTLRTSIRANPRRFLPVHWLMFRRCSSFSRAPQAQILSPRAHSTRYASPV